MNLNKKNIIDDLIKKQSTYFLENYKNESKSNYIRRIRRKLILDNALPYAKNARILDVGSGPAILYSELLDDCASYLALDLAQTNLDQIKNQYSSPKIFTLCSDIDSFTWKGEPFNIIICSGSLEYADSPIKNFEKLLSYLGENGTLIASFPNIISPYRIWDKYFYQFISRIINAAIGKSKPIYHRRYFLPYCLSRIITRSKYKFFVQYFGHKFLPQPFDAIFSTLDYNLTQLFNRKKIMALNWICVEFLFIVYTGSFKNQGRNKSHNF